MKYQTDLQGYEFTTDPANCKQYAIRRSTGEVSETVTMTVPVGTIAYTPEDQEQWKAQKEAEAELRLKRKEEHYFFVSLKHRLDDIAPESAARLLFLCTFLKYGSPILYRTERTPALRRDLPGMMRLARSTVDKFLEEASAYIKADENGVLSVDDNMFYRRQIKGTAYVPHQQVYMERLRSLYYATPSSQHRKLGYIIQMLPLINKEFNILCHNPEERDLNRIERITPSEFCNITGYNYRKLSRLRNEYSSIVFPVGDSQEHFCLFVQTGTGADDAMIILNPHIIYSGQHFEVVRRIGDSFK